MRIRFFSYFYAPCVGGGEVILQHQAEELARRGHEVHVHTTPYLNLNLQSQGEVGSSVEGGVHVHRRRSFRLPMHNPWEKDAVTPAFFAEAWLPADLLVAVGYPSFHLDALLARAKVTRTTLVAQNYITAEFLAEILAGEGGRNKRIRSAFWRHLTRRELAACDLVLADSPAAQRALASSLRLDNVRLHVGMAVDPGEFAAVTPADGAAVRARLGLGGDRLIVAPSRLARQKGADLLVEAAGPLLREGWRLVIAGAVNEPEFAAKVDALRAPYGARILRTELERPALLALLLESDILCLPSRGETVGGVVFEGMYAGALAIVSDAVEAAREVYLHDGENGLLVPSEDVAALRRALERAMTTDTALMREAGRRMVEAEYTWSRSVDRLLERYAEARR